MRGVVSPGKKIRDWQTPRHHQQQQHQCVALSILETWERGCSKHASDSSAGHVDEYVYCVVFFSFFNESVDSMLVGVNFKLLGTR